MCMMWAGISDTGKTPLIILNRKLNAHRYIHEILIPVVLFIANMRGNTVFQDDNARALGTDSQGVHGAAADPNDGVASLLSRPQPY